MDTVKAFNAELSSLYEMKPPISKAKMTAITKGAIKAVKFYKHVVQSVEKFLQKCRPEYKIPGLYVIDSIVRQSRHQFGAEKDVFAPRFSKNITYTFYYIYQCTAEEKSKVIRVLNLWQKNAVFPPEVIQPLFDMADVSHPKYKEVSQFINSRGQSSSSITASKGSQDTSASVNGSKDPPISFEDASNEGSQSQSLVMGNLPSLSSTEMSLATRLQHLQHLFGGEAPNNTNATQAQSTTPAKQPASNDTGQIRFNKKLLDFDYDEEDDEADKNRDGTQQQQQPKPPQPTQAAPPAPSQANNSSETLGNLLINPDILRHLQSLQQQMSQPPANQPAPSMNVNHHMPPKEEGSRWDAGPGQRPFGQFDYTQPPPGFIPIGSGHPLAGPPVGFHPGAVPPPGPFPPQQPPQAPQHLHGQPTVREDLFPPGHNGDVAEIEPPRPKERDRRRSRSGSRGRRGRSRDRHRRSRSRSRSRSRDRGGRSRRSRSRSRNRNTRRGRTRSRDREEREKERQEREKERDRKRRGLPPIKKECLSVCSTTLWVGHLSKLVTQEELSDTFGQYGEIVSIDVIPPRGCAFVCMHRRQDAHRALTKLAGHKLQGKAITLAWAPGKGVKAKEWKDYWEVDQGVSYISWSRLNPMTDMAALEEGGSFDEETLPPWMKQQPNPAEIPEPMQAIPMTPAGFIPIPPAASTVDQGPPTPEVGEQMLAAPGPPQLNATTTLPANLPTYATLPGPLGLLSMPLGMPAGLRLPPPSAGGPLLPGQQAMAHVAATNAAMATHLLGQSILAGLGAAAAQGLGPPGGAGPPGFFNVFNPHVPTHLQEPPVVPSMVPVPNNTSGGDDMDLDDGDDSSQPKEEERRTRWSEPEGNHHAPEGNKNNLPSLLERLRSLANHESAGLIDLHGHPNGADDRQLRPDMTGEPGLFGMSPGLASSLRGAPLTAAGNDIGVRMLHPGGNGPPDGFGTPGRGPLGDDRFGPRHLGGFVPGPEAFGPMRGRPFGHDRRFMNDMADHSWEEESPHGSHGPQPPRWRGQDDWSAAGDRDPPPPPHPGRHWDRERDRGNWSGGPSPRRPPLPPLPPRNDRGRNDRFGDRGDRGRDRGRDRRRSRSRERDRRERRSGGRWSDRRSPEKSEAEPSAQDQAEQAPQSSEAPTQEGAPNPTESLSPERSRAKTPPSPAPARDETTPTEPKEEEPGPPGSAD